MLVLTRKKGEVIRINDNIRIIVHEISRDKVRLGVLAPRDVPVFREELLRTTPPRSQANGPQVQPPATQATVEVDQLPPVGVGPRPTD
jgi:carbon storage regulator